MKIEDYFNRIPAQLKEVESQSETRRGSQSLLFTQYILHDYICSSELNIIDSGFFEEGEAVFRDKSERNLGEISSYTIHEVDSGEESQKYVVNLYYTIFREVDGLASTIPVITEGDYSSAIAKVKGFCKKSFEAAYQVAEQASHYHIANFLYTNMNSITKINICVISNCMVKRSSIERKRDPEVRNILLSYDVNNCWDIERIFHIIEGEGDRLSIKVDLENEFGGKVPCVISKENDKCYTVLAVLPGKILHDLYEEHGDKLLDSNVRLFLGVKKSKNKTSSRTTVKPVNACIRETLEDEPNMFLAYNNGVSATCTSADIEVLGGGIGLIRSISDFQIINGGQTTVSIFKAVEEEGDKIKLDDVYVQMKLTIVQTQDKLDDIIDTISMSSNRQNNVAFSNFSANNTFNRTLELLVNHTYRNGKRWFFDRKGQYKKEKSSRKGETLKVFLSETPKEQVFSKEQVAQACMAWAGKPALTATQDKCYSTFIQSMQEGKDGDKVVKPCDAQDIIAKIMIQRAIETNLTGDRKGLLALYSMCFLAKEFPDLSLFRIYDKQIVPEELLTPLLICAKSIREKIRAEYGEGQDIRNYLKQESVQEWILKQNLLQLDDAVKTKYKQNKEEENRRKNESAIILPEISAHDEIFSKGYSFWASMSNNMSNTFDITTCKTVLFNLTNKKICSEKDLQRAKDLLEKMEGKPELLAIVDRDAKSMDTGFSYPIDAINLAHRFLAIKDWDALLQIDKDTHQNSLDRTTVNTIFTYLRDNCYQRIKYELLKSTVENAESLSRRFRKKD